MLKFYFLFLLILISPLIAFSGQTDPDSIKTYRLSSDVVVTATRISTPAAEIASSYTLISKEEIINSGKVILADLLRGINGLTIVQQSGPGSLTRVFIRGSNPQHTLILLDGIPLNDPGSLSNAFDFANMQTDNIEKIEIIRGPQSTLYGSDALAGVINIFTKQGTGSPKFSLSGEGGALGTYKGNASFSGGSDFMNYSLDYSRFKTEGFSSANEKYGNTEKDGSSVSSLFTRIGIKPAGFINLDFIYKFDKSNVSLDQNEKRGDDPNFTSTGEEASFKTTASLSLLDGLWKPTVGVSYIRNIHHTIDGVDEMRPSTSSDAYANGKRIKLDWQNNLYLNKNNILILGLESTTEQAYSSYNSISEWGPYNSVFPENKASVRSIYIQDQLNFSDCFFATLGTRYDHHDRFGGVVTYRIAPAFVVAATGTKLKATYGTGFKSPSLFYLYDPVTGNPELQPEKNKGWDAGIEQKFLNNLLTLDLTYFRNEFTNLIGTDKNFKSINIDKALTNGIEFSIATMPISNFVFNINYTYTDSRDKSEGTTDSDKPLIRRPNNKTSFTINYSYNNADFNLIIVNVGQRDDKDFYSFPPQRVRLNSYTLAGLAASYQFSKFIKFFAHIDNLFNSSYEEVLYYGTAPRSLYAGLKISL